MNRSRFDPCRAAARDRREALRRAHVGAAPVRVTVNVCPGDGDGAEALRTRCWPARPLYRAAAASAGTDGTLNHAT